MSETVTIVTHRLNQPGKPVRWLVFGPGEDLRGEIEGRELCGDIDRTIEDVLVVDRDEIPEGSAFRACRGEVPFRDFERRQLSELLVAIGASAVEISN